MLRRYTYPIRSGSHSPNLYLRNVIFPGNVFRDRLADEFHGLRWRSWVFPEIKVFEYTPDHRRLLNEGDDFRSEAAFILSTALGTLECINIPDLLKENCPLLSSAPGV